MKFTALFAAATAAVASAQVQDRNLATLAEKWNLTEPVFAYDSNTFNLTFPVTDYITTGMADYSLWTAPDCQSDGGTQLDSESFWASNDIIENTLLSTGTQDDSGTFSGRSATISAAFDPATIEAASIFSATTVNNQRIATIRFCARFGVWTTTGMGVTTPVEVNFLETLITLTVDLTDGFEIGAINVEPKDRLVRTANQAYEVRGYECSATSTAKLSTVEQQRARNQGEIVHVCVTPEDEAQTDGIFMRSVDDFTFTRGTDIRQLAIENNREAGNLLTSYSHTDCEGSLVCRFSTILFAQFYVSAGTVNGEGVASMQFGQTKTGSTRRQLRASDEARELQAQDGAGAAEFDLQFDVNQAEPRGSTSGAGSVSMGFMSVAAIAAAALL